ncbi:uncharacterized protein ColSpa_12753 [Colletotrichum spaethianum]|uniref:Uncharacterized protein n=1 Tax=Colletotrichum spaethianum TaxID=700344 RepID=A0AA37PI41_9PEZI|nr:uncharacterized protein ColSpa_12753 [Colletotrichum spaethianum]GKT52572.1 hypothetical protein ColSpa_12753 [Colletotrichum spaethianum]
MPAQLPGRRLAVDVGQSDFAASLHALRHHDPLCTFAIAAAALRSSPLLRFTRLPKCGERALTCERGSTDLEACGGGATPPLPAHAGGRFRSPAPIPPDDDDDDDDDDEDYTRGAVSTVGGKPKSPAGSGTDGREKGHMMRRAWGIEEIIVSR